MGMLGRIIGGAIGAKVLQTAVNRNAARKGRYIPASQAPVSAAPVTTTAGGSLVDRAGRFYNENPKLVHSVGAAALAVILAAYGKKRGML